MSFIAKIIRKEFELEMCTFFRMRLIMEVFETKSTKDKLIITIDRSSVDARFLPNLLERLRIEQLVKKGGC